MYDNLTNSMKKVVITVDSKDKKKLMEVLFEIIEKQGMAFNEISLNKEGKDKIELSA